MKTTRQWRMAAALGAILGGFLAASAPWLWPSLRGESPEELKANLDLPYDASGDTNDEEDPAEVMVFYGESFDGEGFFYCIDGSMSMGDGEWQTLQRELGRSILGLSSDMQFGFVIFNNELFYFPANGKPTPATAAAKKTALVAVADAAPESWTCLKEGLVKALEMANESNLKKKSIVLLSDGKPTCPGTDFVTYREEIFGEIRSRNTKGVEIHTLGIGADVDESFLKRLARENQGVYRRVNH